MDDFDYDAGGPPGPGQYDDYDDATTGGADDGVGGGVILGGLAALLLLGGGGYYWWEHRTPTCVPPATLVNGVCQEQVTCTAPQTLVNGVCTDPVVTAPPPYVPPPPPSWAQQLQSLGTPIQQGAAMVYWVMLGRLPTSPILSEFDIPFDSDHVNIAGAALYTAEAIAGTPEWSQNVLNAWYTWGGNNKAAGEAAAGAAPGLTLNQVDQIQFAWITMLGRWATPIGTASTESFLTGYTDQGGTCASYTSIQWAGIQDICMNGRTPPGVTGIGTNLAYSAEFGSLITTAVAAQAPPPGAIVNQFY